MGQKTGGTRLDPMIWEDVPQKRKRNEGSDVRCRAASMPTVVRERECHLIISLVQMPGSKYLLVGSSWVESIQYPSNPHQR